MVKVFVSYRRQDSAQVTGRIYDKLVACFGAQAVFKDVDSIPLGMDFRKSLERSISHCDVMIAVIGMNWAGATDPQGRRRLDDQADFVRIEIESALKRSVPIIPLLVDDAAMPAADVLPDSVQDFAFRNATKIRPDPDFHRDMDRVVQAIRLHIPVDAIPLLVPVPESAPRRRPLSSADRQDVAKVLPVVSQAPGAPAQRLRWTRVHNAIAGAICSGALGVFAMAFSNKVEPSSVGAMIFAYLFLGLVTAIPGAIGGAVAKSIWGWVTVLCFALLFGIAGFFDSDRGYTAGFACMGWWLGWFVVMGIVAVRAIIRQVSQRPS